MPARPRIARRLLHKALAVLVGTVVAVGVAPVVAAPAATAANKPTPGSFTGFGFDQCLAPTQSAMDAWLRSSPFWAVGIYVSGYSRACRSTLTSG